jgi:hypothetical protein
MMALTSVLVLRAALCALAVSGIATPLASQAPPTVSTGAYLARHGLGLELQGMLTKRIGAVARAETGEVERAFWAGARLDIHSTLETKAYLLGLAGQHRCYPSTLSGSGSGCEFRRDKWKAGAAALAGFELGKAEGRWSVGAETGHRFVSAGTRPRWTFAATVRYRLHPR